jgi:hypothetical protein
MLLGNSVKYLAQSSKERMPRKQSCNINFSPGLSVLFKNTMKRQDDIYWQEKKNLITRRETFRNVTLSITNAT